MFGVLFQEGKTNYNSITSSVCDGLGEGAGAALGCRRPPALGAAGHAADVPEGALREPVAKSSDSRLGGELSAKVIKAERIMPFPT